MTAPLVDDMQEQQPEPLVWVVVLHYQDAERTRSCLESLQALTHKHLKVLLLDNSSPDHSGQGVASQFPQFDYMRTQANLGFAGGCNAGITYCAERGAQWVWLLNNDARATPDSLTKLVRQALKHPRAGALGALIYTPRGDLFKPTGMGEIDFLRGKTYERRTPPAGAETVACQWLSGCNLLLRVDAFRQVGGFDERYFLYFEDVDLCLRLRQADWQCLLVPQARVDHIGGASTEGRLHIWRTYYYTRNRLLFFLAHSKPPALVPILIAIWAHLLRHLIVLPFRGERGRRQLRAEWLAVSDYLRGRLGQASCLDF